MRWKASVSQERRDKGRGRRSGLRTWGHVEVALRYPSGPKSVTQTLQSCHYGAAVRASVLLRYMHVGVSVTKPLVYLNLRHVTESHVEERGGSIRSRPGSGFKTK